MTVKKRPIRNRELSPETLAAQALGWVDPDTRAVVPPIHPGVTTERNRDLTYSRGTGYMRGTPESCLQAEALLAKLEGGENALLYASGMAAIAAALRTLEPGDHLVALRDLFRGSLKWIQLNLIPWGVEVDFVANDDIDDLARAIRPGKTKMVYLETPSNPTFEIVDLAAAIRVAHDADALVVVDNTVPTPVLTRPIELGADLVVHSATKYLNGHSDVLAGAVVFGAETKFLTERMLELRHLEGAILGPFEAWLLLRGMRTLYLRVQQATASAQQIAEYLDQHTKVKRSLYPGLPGHPGHEIAKRQMNGGFGGLLSFRLADQESAITLQGRLELIKRATSLGGVESLIEPNKDNEWRFVPVPFDLVRLSVGIEDPDDLIADLAQALEAL